MSRLHTIWILTAVFLMPLLASCRGDDLPDESTVPEGMVEIRPVLPGCFSPIARGSSNGGRNATRAYDSDEVTNSKLGKTHRLPIGSTLWLIAVSASDGDGTTGKMEKRAYVVYNPEDNPNMSFLIPCTVDDEGNMVSMEGKPFYLKDNQTYMFYAVSPARKLDDAKFAQGQVAFQIKNGEAFYANDSRYAQTTPVPVRVTGDNSESVQVVTLSPMINQTALIKIQVRKGFGVHDLGIQPSGILVSGLQEDSPESGVYGDENGLFWNMSTDGSEPIQLQHGSKTGILHKYDYKIDNNEYVNIEVPVVPMRSLSKPIIVLLRLKVNGVPTSYELMLNEKDFKAGYSYGYRGEVSIAAEIDGVSWQFVSWEYDVDFPF